MAWSYVMVGMEDAFFAILSHIPWFWEVFARSQVLKAVGEGK